MLLHPILECLIVYAIYPRILVCSKTSLCFCLIVYAIYPRVLVYSITSLCFCQTKRGLLNCLPRVNGGYFFPALFFHLCC